MCYTAWELSLSPQFETWHCAVVCSWRESIKQNQESVKNVTSSCSDMELKTHRTQTHFLGDRGLATNGTCGFIQTVYEPMRVLNGRAGQQLQTLGMQPVHITLTTQPPWACSGCTLIEHTKAEDGLKKGWPYFRIHYQHPWGRMQPCGWASGWLCVWRAGP